MWTLILDNNGNVVDFFCAGWTAAEVATGVITPPGGGSYPVSAMWIGDGVSVVGSSSLSNSRRGNYDNDDATDWENITPSTVVNLLTNPNLLIPFSGGSNSVCDSVAVLNLTINHADTSYTNITACDSLVWNGTTYTQSGTYSYNGGGSNNYSMSFDGIDDYIELTDIDLLQNFTISAWVNTNSLSAWQNIVNKFGDNPTSSNAIGGYALLVAPIGIYAHTNAGTTSSAICATSTYIPINQWSHVSVVLDNGVMEFYINGQFVYSCSGLANTPNTIYNTFIGKASYGMAEFFDGLIDNIEIWDIALNQQQIQQYMNCLPSGDELGLFG